MSEQSNKVAIIGAGPCGLAAAKYALQYGLEPVIFEKSDEIGGQWSTSKSNPTSVWDGLYANISYFSMSYSDLTYPKGTSIVPCFKEVRDYLYAYAEKFQLFDHIQLEHKCDSVQQLDNKKWRLKITSLKTNETTIQTFNFLIVATGLHTKPRVPRYDTIDKFKGIIMHSSKFRLNDEKLKSKKVIVVGHSYSATDISSYLVDHASEIVNVFRRPYLVSQRLMRQKSNLNLEKPNQFHIIPIDFFWFNRAITYNGSVTHQEIIDFNLKNLKIVNYDQTDLNRIHADVYYDMSLDYDVKASVSDNYIGYVKQNRIIPKKGNIERFVDNGVYLNDGSFESADAVIMCSGFNVDMDYFDEKTLNFLGYDPIDNKCPYMTYKCTFHPDAENLALMGLTDGLFFSCFELQAKWIAMVYSGTKTLPSREIMLQEIDSLKENRTTTMENQYPVEYNILLDMLAAETDCLPDFETIKRNDPELYRMLWFVLFIEYFFVINIYFDFD